MQTELIFWKLGARNEMKSLFMSNIAYTLNHIHEKDVTKQTIRENIAVIEASR